MNRIDDPPPLATDEPTPLATASLDQPTLRGTLLVLRARVRGALHDLRTRGARYKLVQFQLRGALLALDVALAELAKVER